MEISRSSNLSDKVVFVDGLPGCGKTLFSTLISSMDRVELLSYSYEIEHICALHYLNRVPMDAAKAVVNLQVDLKLYNQMMGRDANFRPSDLSSVFNYHNPSQYIQRLLNPGDQAVPGMIQNQRPILNLSTHNLLGYSEPIWQALGGRCVFIEVVRHPLYMVKQQALNMENLIGNVRDFTVYYDYNGQELPYYVNRWEDRYLKSNPTERVIYFIDEMTRINEKFKDKFIRNNDNKVLTIPFEKFVLDPFPLMEEISKHIGSKITSVTEQVMRDQKVPRHKVSAGVDIDIYRRCGWTGPIEGASERDELNVRMGDIINKIDEHALSVLDRLIDKYEEKSWKP